MAYIFNTGKYFPGNPLPEDEKLLKLYHYTSFDTFVKIWLHKNLRFGEVQNLNDIGELYSKSVSTPSLHNAKLIRPIIKELKRFKQISLTLDYDSYIKGCMSPMMWGHYGAKQKGVCIELDFEKLKFKNSMYYDEVVYVDYLKDAVNMPSFLEEDKDLYLFIKENIKDFFFTKTKDWSGENEYRIVSLQDDFLDISDAISCVYVIGCESETCLNVEKLVGSECEVYEFFYGSLSGKRIPNIRLANKARKQLLDAKLKPNNFLNSL